MMLKKPSVALMLVASPSVEQQPRPPAGRGEHFGEVVGDEACAVDDEVSQRSGDVGGELPVALHRVDDLCDVGRAQKSQPLDEGRYRVLGHVGDELTEQPLDAAFPDAFEAAPLLPGPGVLAEALGVIHRKEVIAPRRGIVLREEDVVEVAVRPGCCGKYWSRSSCAAPAWLVTASVSRTMLASLRATRACS